MKSCFVGRALVGVSLVLLMSSTVQAQATRTWVSGVGDDVNPCSRTAPCRTLAGAISKTAAGGEISVLDPMALGAVTITKSISISGDPSMGSALHGGVNGVLINAGATDVISLQGLILEGAGTSPGANGIRFIAGGALHVRNCVIRNSRSPIAGQGHGILFQPSGVSDLFVSDTFVSNNGTLSNGGGILIKPTGSGAATVMLDNVRMVGNVFGLKADATTSPGGVFVTIRNSVANGNAFSGLTAITAPAGGLAWIMVDRLTSANNGTTGVKSDGSNAIVTVGNSTISMNGIGFQSINSGQLLTQGNNTLFGNASNGAASGYCHPASPELRRGRECIFGAHSGHRVRWRLRLDHGGPLRVSEQRDNRSKIRRQRRDRDRRELDDLDERGRLSVPERRPAVDSRQQHAVWQRE